MVRTSAPQVDIIRKDSSVGSNPRNKSGKCMVEFDFKRKHNDWLVWCHVMPAVIGTPATTGNCLDLTSGPKLMTDTQHSTLNTPCI